MLLRRCLTISGFVGLTLLMTIASPVLVAAAYILSLLPSYRGALATLGLILGYLWCEVIGIFTSAYLRLRYRDPAAFEAANYNLQYWWAETLRSLTVRLFKLEFIVENEAVLSGPPVLMLPRHASIADTIIPILYYAIPHGVRLRYVLKKELLMDPSIDIVGHRLPNYFVDRGGDDSEGARQGVTQLIRGLGPREGAVLYPEGTRYTPAKRAALLARYQESPDMRDQLNRWTRLLPPRLGGTVALLEANPGLDVAFCAHTGFEGSSHFSNLINGSWMGSAVRIRFWRIPYSDIPTGAEAKKEFLFEQWDRMQAEVIELSASAAGPGLE